MQRWNNVTRPYAARWSRFRRSARRASSKVFHEQQPEPGSSRPLSPWRLYARRLRVAYIQNLHRPLYLAFVVFLAMHIEFTYFYSWDLTYGVSMLPTINAVGDSVIISKLYRRGKDVHIGDVVSFDHPVDQQTQSVKRVVGLEGDWVCRDTPGVGSGTMIQIPAGHCWVVGDNLTHSRDSRLFGPLPMALIKGKVLARFRGFSTFEWLENGLQPSIEDEID